MSTDRRNCVVLSTEDPEKERPWLTEVLRERRVSVPGFTLRMNQITCTDKHHELDNEDAVYHVVAKSSDTTLSALSFSGTFDDAGDVPDCARLWFAKRKREALEVKRGQAWSSHVAIARRILEENGHILIERVGSGAADTGVQCDFYPCSSAIFDGRSSAYSAKLQLPGHLNQAEYCLCCAEDLFGKAHVEVSKALISTMETQRQLDNIWSALAHTDAVSSPASSPTEIKCCEYPPTLFQHVSALIQAGQSLSTRDAAIVNIWKTSSVEQVNAARDGAACSDELSTSAALAHFTMDNCYGRNLSEMLRLKPGSCQ